MAWPTFTVEIAFTTLPLDTPTWVDVSAYFRGFEMVTGRSSPADRFQPGECAVELSNIDRRFDPFHSSGPYYGDLLPGRRVRIRATYDSTTYPLFDGFVDDDGFQQSYTPPGDAICTVRCVDALGILSAHRLRNPWAYAAQVPSSLVAWYPFDGDRDGGIITDIVAGSHGQWLPGAIASIPPLFLDDQPVTSDGITEGSYPVSSGAVTFGLVDGDPTTGGVVGARALAAFKSGVWSVGFVLRCKPANKIRTVLSGGVYEVGGSGVRGVSVTIDTNGILTAWCGQGVSLTSIPTTFRVDDGELHGIVVARDASNLALFVDGAEIATTSHLDLGVDTSMTKVVIGDDYRDLQLVDHAFDGDLDEMVVYDAFLSDTDAIRLSGAPRWENELTGTRVARILDQVGWPTGGSWRALDAGSTICGPQGFDGVEVGEAVGQVERTEQGWFYASNAGVLTFLARSARHTVSRISTVQWTFTDKAASTSGTQRRYDTPSFGLRSTRPRSSVIVQWPGGQLEDTDLTVFGLPRSMTVDTVLTTAHEADNLLDWTLARWNATRNEAVIRLSPHADNTLWATCLSLQLLDAVTIERHPQNAGSTISLTGNVQSIRHRGRNGRSEWATEIIVADAERYPTEAIWGTDLWGTGTWGY